MTEENGGKAAEAPINRSPSNAPVAKVVAGTVAAAVAAIIVWLIQLFADVDVPIGIEGAITTVFAFLGGYVTPPKGWR